MPPTVGISFNKTQPESFGAVKNPGVCLNTPELYRWIYGGGEKAQAEEFFADLNSPDDGMTTNQGGSIDMPAGCTSRPQSRASVRSCGLPIR